VGGVLRGVLRGVVGAGCVLRGWACRGGPPGGGPPVAPPPPRPPHHPPGRSRPCHSGRLTAALLRRKAVLPTSAGNGAMPFQLFSCPQPRRRLGQAIRLAKKLSYAGGLP